MDRVYIAACAKRKIKVNSQLAQLLGAEQPLRRLILSKNYVGCENGFDCLLEVIAEARELAELDLSGCFLTTENVKSLVEVALPHPALARLRLKDNRLYIESGKALARLARFNPRIKLIDVVGGSNKIPAKFVEQINVSLAMNNQSKRN